MQSYECPSCDKTIEIKEETNIDDFNCPFCSQCCELDFYDDGLSAHHWYIIKKEDKIKETIKNILDAKLKQGEKISIGNKDAIIYHEINPTIKGFEIKINIEYLNWKKYYKKIKKRSK